MKKLIIIAVSILTIIFCGCSNKEVIEHNYIYTGENENWTAEYTVTGVGIFTEKDGRTNYESEHKKRLEVTYKKDISNLALVKNLEISYETSVGGGSSTLYWDDDESIMEKSFILSGVSRNGAIENKDETIKVSIDIDGNVEKIELKNKL